MYQTTFILLVIGALNWLLVGLFQYDLVSALFGGVSSILSRIIYTLLGLAGVYGLSLLLKGTPLSER